MKKILSIAIAIIFVLAGLGAVGTLSDDKTVGNFYESDFKGLFDDTSAYRYQTALYSTSEDVQENHYNEEIKSNGVNRDYPIGEIIWQYYITGGSDNSVKAITPIPDINGDGIDDVIVCSEDYYVRCFDGGAIGTGVVLWEHFIYSGKLWCQNELTITEDVDGDGYNDVVVGTPWGDRSIHTLSGKTGEVIWTYGSTGGWVYQVDCSYDYNGDDVIDVLAAAGSTADRAYCLNGLTGASIWECSLGGGPGFSVIGIEDFTGDGQPDVLVGASNSAETIGYAYGINGATGSITWTFTAGGSSVWALEQIDDVTGDGIKDVIIGDSFTGNIYGLDATTGGMEYSNSLGSAGITRFAKLNDVNGDGHPDFIPAHSILHVTQVIDGYTGSIIWSHPVADQPWNVARTADISGDGIDDVLVGTLYNNNYCYFLNGVNGSELEVVHYYEAVDAIAAIPDVVADGSMEMVAGGRNGKVTCFSGGLDAVNPNAAVEANFTADITEGIAPLTVHFTDLSTAENTTITSWKWDFDNDSIIDSEEQNPVWTYTGEGIYTVSLTVSDGTISDKETKVDYITVLPAEVLLEIGNITGGKGVTVAIKNVGDGDVTNVKWNITIDGGLIIIPRTDSGDLGTLAPGQSANVTFGPMGIGLGIITAMPKITVGVECAEGSSIEKSADARIILFFVMIQ